MNKAFVIKLKNEDKPRIIGGVVKVKKNGVKGTLEIHGMGWEIFAVDYEWYEWKSWDELRK
ncbi:hypothetical protein [Faecalibaculum rodentium]|jgi:hypothetical protein|uniref:hypothetical protein n=1 Tax=Faecalibaculum rodentium TaxID=1702221 RepID=UPI0023F3B839|nr:hypothetical protein [Faecalibaculum rodentium]